MTQTSSTIFILIVIAFAFYLIYSQNNQPQYIQSPPQIIHQPCPTCKFRQNGNNQGQDTPMGPIAPPRLPPAQPQITNVVVDTDQDPYSDAIKKQDYQIKMVGWPG